MCPSVVGLYSLFQIGRLSKVCLVTALFEMDQQEMSVTLTLMLGDLSNTEIGNVLDGIVTSHGSDQDILVAY